MSSTDVPPDPAEDGRSRPDPPATDRSSVDDTRPIDGAHEAPTGDASSTPSSGTPGEERSERIAETAHLAAPDWLSALTAGHWAAAALAAVGAYVAMLLSAVLLLVLTFTGAALSADGATPTEIVDDATASSGVGSEGPGAADVLIRLPIQLVAMAFFGRLTLVLKTPSGGGPSGAEAFSLLFAPLLITAVGAVTLYLLGRRLLRRVAPVGAVSAWALSLAGGLVLAVLVVLLASTFGIRYSDDGSAYPMSLSVEAASGPAFFLTWLTGALVLAVVSVPRSSHRAAGSLRALREQYLPSSGRALTVLWAHLAVFGVPMAVGLIVAASVQGGWAAGLSAPLWIPTAVLWFFSWGHLSGVSASAGGSAREVLAWADVPGSGTSYLWGIGAPGWVVAVVLVLAALAALAASVVWLLRRDVGPAALARPASWLTVPVIYFLFGLLLTAVGRVAAGADAAAFGLGIGATADVLLRPAGWTCLVLLVVGALVEALSRFVAPAVVPALPAGVVARLGGPTRSAAAAGPGPRQGAGADRAPAAASAPRQRFAAADRQPMSEATRKRVRTALIAGGSLAALAVAAAVTHSALSRTVFSPGNQVESYLQSVADGRATDAVEQVDPNVPAGQRLLLDDDVYGAAARPVTDFSIRDVAVDGTTAEVSAEIMQDGVSTPVNFTLVQDGRQAGVFKDWRIQDGGSALYQVLSVDVPAGATELTVNEQPLDLAAAGVSSGGTVNLVALPGDYVIAPPPGGKYMGFGAERTVEIRADDSNGADWVTFTASPTDAVHEDAVAAADAMIDACAARAEFDPEDCPFGYSIYGDDEDYRNPVWTVDSYPTYTVEGSGDSLYLSTDDPGKVALTYEYDVEWDDEEPADWDNQDSTQSVYVSAPIQVDGDSLKIGFSG